MARAVWALIVAGATAWAAMPQARADEFDRLEGPVIAGIPRSKDAATRPVLSFGDLEGLPNLLKETRSALVVATTDQGNFTRMLLVPGLRKTPGAAKGVPVLVVERFETFESGNLSTRLARGRDLILFDRFRLDLDSGQVVPEGQGADVQFLADGKGGPRLEALASAKLYTLSKLPADTETASARPSVGRSVLPSDFAGRFRLFANGQWSGLLDLKVDDAGDVTGRFRSDLNGAAYPVNGKVAADVPQKVSFTVKFPRTQQDYEGLLWTEGKGAMAGTLTMRDRAYGFFAVREGGKVGPEGEELGTLAKGSNPAGRRTVTFRKGEYALDGRPMTDQELGEALKRARAGEPATWVLLQVSDDEPYGAVQKAIEVIGLSGVSNVRLGPADPSD